MHVSLCDFTGGTDLLVWRDAKVSQGPFICPAQVGRPSWFPLGQEGIVIFDEQENPDVPTTFPGRFSMGFDAIQLDSACNANHSSFPP